MKILIFLFVFLLNFNTIRAETYFDKNESDVLNDSKSICTDQWTKRGVLDDRMFNYCMRVKQEGFNKFLEINKYKNQSFYSDIAYPYCAGQWVKRGVFDAEMMSFCLNQEIEGVKDVIFYRKEYGDEIINPIVEDALSRFKSWNMASYLIKQKIKNN